MSHCDFSAKRMGLLHRSYRSKGAGGDTVIVAGGFDMGLPVDASANGKATLTTSRRSFIAGWKLCVTSEMMERAGMIYAACMSGTKIELVEKEWSEYPDAMRQRWINHGCAILSYALKSY